jgi:maltose/maltodextrin transport system permease protein
VPPAWATRLRWTATAAAALALLGLTWLVASTGQAWLAAAWLAASGLGLYVYTARPAYTWRYLFPGLAGMAIFVVLPIAYTVRVGFTNYSARNLLTFERATRYLLDQTTTGEGGRYAFTLHRDGQEFRLLFTPLAEEGAAAAPPVILATPPLALRSAAPPEIVEALPLAGASFEPGEPLPLKELVRHREVLSRLTIRFPGGGLARMAGLREFAPLRPLYRQEADGSLVDQQSGERLRPDHRRGFYVTPAGEPVRPGFKVDVGLANYGRLVSDPEFRGPFLAIFAWTVVFALLTVLFTVVVGCTLAVVINWDALRFRNAYRTLLFLPYAVPGFISILVFRGLFNQSFGEVNLILDRLLGIRPSWFADPLLAKVMILIVNTWLGYPYVMMLCTGLIKAIPADLYEASALDGASPLTNFFRITAPLIIRPLTPLLIASFAFNFNNFVLISLLTDGRPDFLNTRVPAGTTDILVSYTYRIAFQDSGQNFGLAAAISTVVFFLVAVLSMINLRLTRSAHEERP